jgi:hypothetical protein
MTTYEKSGVAAWGPPDYGSGGGIPPGVTFESIVGGPTYYTDAGHTRAATFGFDNPDFFPIGAFLLELKNQTDADTLINRGINGLFSVSAPNLSSLSTMRSNNLWLVAQADELSQILTANGGSLGSESVGINVFDEPSTYAEAIGAIQTVANTHQDNRFLYENYTWNQLNSGNVQGHVMNDLLNDLIATPNATTRHLHIVGDDIYWFSGYNGADGGAFNSQTLYDLGAILTNDQRRRGARYGDMCDWMRLGYSDHSYGPWQPDYPAPYGVWIETGSPYTENNDTAQRITPAEFNAACWNTIIHGARFLKYFHNHDFGSAGTDSGMASQMAATGALVQQLAGVINSPFALGYGSATSPSGGWKWGDSSPNALTTSGVDTMVKYYNVSGGDNKFYLFAHPRYSGATTSQSVTFTIADTDATVATVINESRTVSISGGTFTDTFATGHTVHIYRIES